MLDELDGAAGGTEAHSAVAALVKLLTGQSRLQGMGAADAAAYSAHGQHCTGQ